MTSNNQEALTDLVELHERSWGMEQYPGRPKLSAILNASVVVFWQSSDSKETRSMITLYQSFEDLEKQLTRLLFRSTVEPPPKSVAKIFKDGKQVIVSGVKILFREVNPP